jgi:PAS domain S-box-containing protein
MELQGEAILQAIVRDITESKRAEERIRQGAEEWQRTFDSMSDFVFLLDLDSRIVRINKAFKDKLGPVLGDVVGKKCYEVMHKGRAHWPSCPLADTVNNLKSHTAEVDDPQIGIPLLVTTSPILDDKGRLTGVVHIAKDITDLRNAEKAIRESMEVKEQFISIASHELRAPLGIIKESFEIINESVSNVINPQIRKFLDIAKRNIDRLVRLSNDILDLQKMEAGKVEFHIQEHDMNEVIEEAVSGVSDFANEKGLKLSLELAKELPKVRFDKDKIVEVLTNFLNNAVKFTDKGGIRVASERDNSGVVVSVADTGSGIAEHDLPKLFKKFQQVGLVAERKPGGTGLGLAICKEIIEKHKGRIWAESERGVMTKFSFCLPF